MSLRYQNDPHTTDRVPGYYSNNRLYKDSYARTDWVGRTSRRIHDGLNIDKNYGLDTVSDDVNSSPYSTPYYINGRYNSDNQTTQRGNSASVQGCTELLTLRNEVEDFTEDDIQTTIEMWQGKQIKFEIPYHGKVVGHTVTLKNTGGCRGILSFYFSASEDGEIITETAIDLCSISQDDFEHKQLTSNIVIPALANPRGKLYVRMEIWDEIDCKRSTNPFNTGRKIEIAATGLSNHQECINQFTEKNVPVKETYNYTEQPSRPCMGLVYNKWESVPAARNEGLEMGATVSKEGYSWDIFCIKSEGKAEVVVYDRNVNKEVTGTNIQVDGRIEELSLVQIEDEVRYTDGYSPLQKFKVGEWQSSKFPISEASTVQVSINLETWVASGIAPDGGTYIFYYKENGWNYKDEVVDLATYGITVTGEVALSGVITVNYTAAGEATEATADVQYSDGRPVIAASKIVKHNNRLYLTGFRNDHNLIQFTEITVEGPDFNSFIYRFYSPNDSPKSNTTNPITAITEYDPGTLYIGTLHGGNLYTTNADVEGGYPTQQAIPSDNAGVVSQGDICTYRGVIYSFDPDEGIRRFTGQLWNSLPHSINTLFERVDMTKRRKLWGYAYKLYLNYYDKVDGKAKCIVWDMNMNYQQYPWFQDVDIPFCDQRSDDDFNIIGIHPDFPCIMRLYDQDVWRRLDSPIEFRRDTKYISLPGNAADMILRRVHIKTLANANRWWWIQLSYDKHDLEQHRGGGAWYRSPVWDTIKDEQPPESPFRELDVYEEKAVQLTSLTNINSRAISTQVRIRAKTFRAQANLISVLMESRVREYL